MRTFKARRISSAKALRSKCVVPETALIAPEDRARSVKVWSDAPVDVRVRIDAAASRYVHEWPLVPGQRLERAPKGAVDVCARVYGLVETMRWVLRWGGAAEALEPPELREQVASEIRRAMAHYAPKTMSAGTKRAKRVR
jgi:predicted DNA-binding transcriptional regulator YafY